MRAATLRPMAADTSSTGPLPSSGSGLQQQWALHVEKPTSMQPVAHSILRWLHRRQSINQPHPLPSGRS